MLTREGWITVVVLLLIIASFVGYYLQVNTENQQEALQQSPAAQVFTTETSFNDLSGNAISLSDYLGQTVIAFSWASWCPTCAEQLQTLGDLADANSDVIVLAFNRGEPISTAVSYLEYYNVANQVELIMDTNDTFFTSIGGTKMPALVIFDSTGEIIYQNSGAFSRSAVLEALE